MPWRDAVEVLQMLNPIEHARSPKDCAKYQTEPYAVAADVYSLPSQQGRGGWTWYTGSASWMYRAGLESILGFKLLGDRLVMDPCIPRWWREFEIVYRRDRTTYRIKVENPLAIHRGVASVELDGVIQAGADIALSDDNQTHTLRVVLGEKPEPVSGPESEGEKPQVGVESKAAGSR